MSLDESLFQIVERAVSPLRQEIAELRKALSAQGADDRLDTDGAALVAGKRNPDGSANRAAFKTFLARHPDFPRERVGRRLVFSRSAIRAWIEAQPRRRGAEQ